MKFKFRNKLIPCVLWGGVIFVFLSLTEAIILVKYGPRMKAKVTQLKDKYHANARYQMMHEEKVDISKLPVLMDDTTAWYSKYHLISHGGGGIDGRNYTNSLEAWEYSYAHGNRVIDADLRFTSDGVLVLRHSWNDNIEQDDDVPMRKSNIFVDENGHTQYNLSAKEKILDYETFRKIKPYHLYTPMSYADMVDFMKTHNDLYVAADVKGDINVKGDVAKTYRYMIDEAKKKNATEILDRIIVSSYVYADYEKIMKLYSFKCSTMRQHAVSPNNYYELAKFCVEHNIHVVNVSQCFLDDPGVKLLMSKGIKIYVAVVDYISDAEYFKKKGVSGFVTNYLFEDMFKGGNNDER